MCFSALCVSVIVEYQKLNSATHATLAMCDGHQLGMPAYWMNGSTEVPNFQL